MTISVKKLADAFGVKPNGSSTGGIKTGVGRFSYFYCLNTNRDGKYSTAFIFSKSDKEGFKNIAQAVINAVAGKHGADMSKWPKTLKCPVGDGDEERDGEEFDNAYYFNCGTTRKPGVVDNNLNPVDPEEAFSGSYGRLSVNFYYFDKEGNRGVGCGLNNVMVTKIGERIDGVKKAEDEFADFKNEDSDGDIPF